MARFAVGNRVGVTNRTLGQPTELTGAIGTIIAIGNEVELDPGVPGHVSWASWSRPMKSSSIPSVSEMESGKTGWC